VAEEVAEEEDEIHIAPGIVESAPNNKRKRRISGRL
jgi:predicted secreted protein